MTKRDAIALMKKDAGITSRQAEKAFVQLLWGMKESMKNGEKVTFSGLGSFSVKEFQARIGRNPKTGEKISVPPKKLPFFKVGKELKERIDNVEGAPPGAE